MSFQIQTQALVSINTYNQKNQAILGEPREKSCNCHELIHKQKITLASFTKNISSRKINFYNSVTTILHYQVYFVTFRCSRLLLISGFTSPRLWGCGREKSLKFFHIKILCTRIKEYKISHLKEITSSS